MKPTKTPSCLFDYDDIVTPRIVAIVSGGGTGSKLFQSFLDNHKQIIMIPAYPLLYFYPHWLSWEKEFKDQWNWETLIDAFCSKHASVLDSRRIPGHNGLTKLGENQDEHVEIDENLFRSYLTHLLGKRKIHRRVFLLAVHYAYALCKKEDITKKKILVYHIHDMDYLVKYLVKDFPDVKTIVMLRDQRSSIRNRTNSNWNIDDAKMNKTDAMIYRQTAYCFVISVVLNDFKKLNGLSFDNVMGIKHEELAKYKEIMPLISTYLGIEFLSSMLEITFDGKAWWGDKVYDMEPMNIVNPRVLSQEWQKAISLIDWFVIEGLLFDYFKKYNYQLYKYTKDSISYKILLFFTILIPSKQERSTFIWYLNPFTHIQFIKASIDECKGRVPLKDYTWNATYLYNRHFLEFKLWRRRWYRSFLNYGQQYENGESRSSIKYVVKFITRIVYVLANYGRFCLRIVLYPFFIGKRWKHSYFCYFKRLNMSNYLPDSIEI